MKYSGLSFNIVSIHNKNGKGLLLVSLVPNRLNLRWSQSTIKMEKGYYGKVTSLSGL